MKKNMFRAILSLIFSLSTVLAMSQNLSPEEVKSKIIKSWTATEVGAPNEEMFPKKNMERMDFKADGSLHMEQESSMMGVMTMEAKWHFDDKKQRLIMTIEMEGMSEEQELEIVELTDTRLILVSSRKQTAYMPSESIID